MKANEPKPKLGNTSIFENCRTTPNYFQIYYLKVTEFSNTCVHIIKESYNRSKPSRAVLNASPHRSR